MDGGIQMNINDVPRYFNSKQAMHYLNIKSYNTLYKLINNGLPVKTVAGVKRFDRTELDTFMSSNNKKQ